MGRIAGGASFSSSFGPGRYSVFTCVDFKGDGYNFTSPTEYGTWLGDSPIQFTTNIQQQYFGTLCIVICLLRLCWDSTLHQYCDHQVSCQSSARCSHFLRIQAALKRLSSCESVYLLSLPIKHAQMQNLRSPISTLMGHVRPVLISGTSFWVGFRSIQRT